MFTAGVVLMGFLICSTGIVDCGAELVLGAVWVIELTLEVTKDVAGATEAVAGSELLGAGGEMVIPESIITLSLAMVSTISSWMSSVSAMSLSKSSSSFSFWRNLSVQICECV